MGVGPYAMDNGATGHGLNGMRHNSDAAWERWRQGRTITTQSPGK